MNDAGARVFAAILGACIGSFLNVVAWRLPRGESLSHPPSRCPKCGAGIRWFDNVPILSWLALRARCRRCRAPISVRYPIVEALTAALFWLVAWRAPPLMDAGLTASLALLAATLVAISLIDLDTRLIPDRISKPGIAVGVLLSLLVPALHPAAFPALANRNLASMLEALLGVATGAGVILVVRFLGTLAFRKEAMGLGDVKLLAMIGAFLRPVGVLYALLLASLLGSVVGVVYVIVRRRRPAPLEGTIGGTAFHLARVRPTRARLSVRCYVRGEPPAVGASAPFAVTVRKDPAWFDADVPVRGVALVRAAAPAGDGLTAVDADLTGLSEAHDDALTTFAHARVAVPFGPFLAAGGLAVALHHEAISRFVLVDWPRFIAGGP